MDIRFELAKKLTKVLPKAKGITLRSVRMEEGAALASAIAAEIRERAFSLAVWLYGFVGTITGWMMTLVYMVIYLASRPLEGSDVSRVMLGVSDRTRNSVRFLIDEFIEQVGT